MNDKKCANGIPEKYLNKIKALELEKVSPREYEDKGDHAIITIDGGFNGTNDWVIDLVNDCPDDVWTLRIGVDK